MMPPHLPILRSPPFPGVDAEAAAVSQPGTRNAIDRAEDMGGVITAIREARVGGTFWGTAPDCVDGVILVRLSSIAEATALPGRLAAERHVLALLPDEPWSAAARSMLEAGNIACHIGEADLWPLFDRAARIEAPGDDEAVLLALIAGLPVTCVSSGRFAGLGLTNDAPGTAQQDNRTLETLAKEALCYSVRYRDCFTGETASAMEAVALLADWRRLIDANRGIAVAAGIALWKRREVKRLLWNGARPLRFARTTQRAIRIARDGAGAIAAWPSRVPADMPEAAATSGIALHRVEDGFIRSVGLGSNLHPPLSIVVDAGGIYYDPASGSDLEALLASHDFPQPLLDRARSLAETIVRAGISKYSSGAEPFRLDSPPGRRRILVAGQVEDDLSVRLGGGEVAGNHDLLTRARAAEPDAYILFKPHPDVDAGHRAGRIDDADALRIADRVIRDISMPALFGAVDGVHVLTSLAGYEALLRGLAVTVHGSPFYAGWGLTRDLGPTLPRRVRRLTIEQLTAAALILYPRYLDPVTGLPCPPETLVRRLSGQQAPRETTLIRARRVQGWLRRTLSPIGRPA